MPYQPQPINTAEIELPEAVKALSELLAKNAHEVWAQGRFAEGWRYGPSRDDIKKLHPGLIPYEELSEGEKQYDRNTAIETLKVMLVLGYRIVKQNKRTTEERVSNECQATE